MSDPAKKKTSFTNSEFPVDGEHRTYHIGVRAGEIANRLLTVGDVNRVRILQKYLNPIFFDYVSDRGFCTVTGLFNGVPITIQSSLMGYPNLDFQIRENLAVVKGILVVIRFGTCGTPDINCKVGDLAIATECRGIYRNPDAFRSKATVEKEVKFLASSPIAAASAPLKLSQEHYHITLPTLPDPQLFLRTKEVLLQAFPTQVRVGLNFSGCTFYASQGRVLADIEDNNEALLDRLENFPGATSIEMETFHLFDLGELSKGRLKVAGTHLILANRPTKEFLTNEVKEVRVNEYGQALLKVLAEYPIAEADLMKGDECVWVEKKK